MARAPYLFPVGSQFGPDNLVLHARAKQHRVDNFAGPLSIKTVLSGQASWMVRGRSLVVDSCSLLVLTAGEPYSMNIQAESDVETCCAFFADQFVETIAQGMLSPIDEAISGSARKVPELPYLTAIHEETSIRSRLQTLTRRCEHELHPSGGEEEFLLLGMELLHLYSRIRDEAARIPAARAGTREELYRRVLIGREFLHSHTSEAVSLAALCKTACLSQFHFHRAFSRAFQQTPHEYLTNLRLAKSRAMLEKGRSALEACLEAGFSSPSAFSRAFKNRYGVPPSATRRKFASEGKKPS